MTHSSAVGRGRRVRRSNERLEFLGDRVLGLVIAELLIRRFRPRAKVLCRAGMPPWCVAKPWPRSRSSSGSAPVWSWPAARTTAAGGPSLRPLPTACEALIGALYLDGGLAPAAAFVTRHWSPRLHAMPAPPQDPKTALQEWAQGRGLALPDYRVVEVAGPAHAPRFEISVQVGDLPPVTAAAGSKRAAEQSAAEQLLSALAAEPEATDG